MLCTMRYLLFASLVATAVASILPDWTRLRHSHQEPLTRPPSNISISQALFEDLEELSRIVDIAYCVGTLNTGVDPPFQCLSYCNDFPSFELVQTWNTGFAFTDSCGFIALSHSPARRRIIVAFRGTYSIANALIDLSAAQQEYLPYPSDGHSIEADKCEDCGVHRGFLESWSQTEKIVAPIVKALVEVYPAYNLTLVGHSLGGAVAALAGLDFMGRGWDPIVTTFGEPKVGNENLAEYFNTKFDTSKYQRVTHINDPVPLLPPASMGYCHHAHELYITAPSVPCAQEDIRRCSGNNDPECIAGTLFFVPAISAHRDYFHRMGLCLPANYLYNKFSGGELK